MAIPEKDYPMYEAMNQRGGSFVRALAKLLQHADPVNYKKLEETFPAYFLEYRTIAIKLKIK